MRPLSTARSWASGASDSVFQEQAESRVSLGALGLAVLLGAGAYGAATVARSDGMAGGFLLAVPALYAVAVSGAAVLAYLLYARARVCDDERLRWLGAGYALAGIAALLQALSLPGFSVTDPIGTSRNGAAALYLVWHVVVPTCALLAVATPRWSRGRAAVVAAALCAVALAAWEPATLPTLVVDGTFTPLYRGAVSTLAVYAAVATAVWTIAAGRRPTWPEAWITVSLIILTFDLILGSAASDFFGPLWWASASLRAATFALAAGGLLTEFVRLFERLRRHERGLADRAAQEVEIAVQARRSRNGGDPEPGAAARIQRVLAEEAFTMVFQPVFDLATGAQTGTEALARFTPPPIRTPDLWFTEAATIGRGSDLELAAMRRALVGAAALSPDLYLGVNVSPDTILDTRLHDLCSAMPHHGLLLEVTEHAEVEDYRLLSDALVMLRARGAKLAVDDAGAGFASLRHIVRLEPDVIKLDISLVHDIHLDPVRRSLAAALVAFADQIGSIIVAEGIETDEELDVLQQLGVHSGQGYRLARPGPLAVPAPGAA